MPIHIIIVLAILLIVAVGSIGYAVIVSRNMKSSRPTLAKGSGGRNFYYYFYKAFSETPVIKRYFLKFANRLQSLYPADYIEINKRATIMMIKSILFASGTMAGICFLCRGDLFYMLVGLVAVYVIFTNSLSKSVSDLELKLLKQFADFLTDCRSNYHQSGMVDEAIYATLNDIKYEIGLHINIIYEILAGTDTENEVEKYTDIAPNRFLNMFAAVCATIKEYGDKRLENGESLFLKNLEYIKQEVYVEINKQERNNFLFSGMVFSTVFPLFCMKLISAWATTISDLSTFYSGSAGMTVMAIVFVTSFISYELVSNLRDGVERSEKEHKFLEWVASRPIINSLLTMYVNRHYTASLRQDDSLKMVGDHISPQAYLVQRILSGVVSGIIVAFLVLTTWGTNKIQLISDFSEEFNDSVVPNEEYRDLLRETANEYVNRNDLNYDLLGKELDENSPELNLQNEQIEKLSEQIQIEKKISYESATEVAKVVKQRNTELAKSYFKWYYLLIIIAAYFIGYFAPLGLLKYRTSVARMGMDDEVAQYQSLALILMNVDGMTLDVVLEWMERFAFCFKPTISECILNLESSEQEALEHMKQQETFPPFLRFVDNLMNIDEVGVASAFDEVKTEQENYKEQRALKNEINMKKRSKMANVISYAPMAITVVGYMLLPFLLMAFNLMQQFQNLQ